MVLPVSNKTYSISSPPPVSDSLSEMANDRNFMTLIRELVARILAQLSQISDQARQQAEVFKREYQVDSQSGADMQRKMGTLAPMIAAAAFAINLSQFMLGNPDHRSLVKFLSEQVPGVGQYFNSRYSAQQMEFQAEAGLRQTQLNAHNSKAQSDSGSRQELLQLLHSALNAMGAASRN